MTYYHITAHLSGSDRVEDLGVHEALTSDKARNKAIYAYLDEHADRLKWRVRKRPARHLMPVIFPRGETWVFKREVLKPHDDGSIHSPRYKYDCNRCKFHWNCGPTCHCGLKLPEPPRQRQDEVDAALVKIGYKPQFHGEGAQRR